MNRLFSFRCVVASFVLCTDLLAWGGGAEAAPAYYTPRQKLRSLQVEVEELYSARFALNAKGVPSVTIGVMEGQRSVSFVPLHRVTAIIYQADGSPRAISLSRGRRYTISLVRGRPAYVRYALVAFELRRSRWGRWATLVKQWKKLGYAIQSSYTGSVFAVRGKLFDNRRRLGILSYASRAFRARLQASRIAARVGRPVQVHTFVQQRPEAMMRLSGAGRSLFSKDLIQIRSNYGVIRVDRVEFGRGYSWHKFKRRSFLGSLLVAVDQSGRLALVNRIDMPAYLAGLLAAEMPLRAPVEALKAQSVCARNEILAKIGTRHHADPFLFCAHTHCQVYTGVHRAHRRIQKILLSTRGEVMVDRDGQLADASYSSVCGGHTENNENVWRNSPRPALRGKLDGGTVAATFRHGINEQNIQQWLHSPPHSYCRSASPFARRKFRWTKTVRARYLNSRINQRYPLGHVTAIRVLRRGVSGRAYVIELVGQKRSLKIRGELRIRRLFANLNSSMFVVREVKNSEGRIVAWQLTGGGWGHGVGMCQYGAIGRAKEGSKYRAILNHYFSNISIVKLYR